MRRLIEELFCKQGELTMSQRAIRHLIAGGLATLLYMAGVSLLVELVGLHPVAGAAVSFLAMEVFNYIACRTWVYNATQSHDWSIPRFVALTVLALALNTGIMFLFVEVWSLWYVWGLFASALVIPPTNFLLSYFWVFR